MHHESQLQQQNQLHQLLQEVQDDSSIAQKETRNPADTDNSHSTPVQTSNSDMSQQLAEELTKTITDNLTHSFQSNPAIALNNLLKMLPQGATNNTSS